MVFIWLLILGENNSFIIGKGSIKSGNEGNLHILGCVLGADSAPAAKTKNLPLSEMCRVIDELIRQMNWNSPDIIIPPGTSLLIAHAERMDLISLIEILGSFCCVGE